MFTVDKKGYVQSEVDAYLKRLSDDYASVLDALNQKIEGLEAAVAEKDKKINAYREKYALIGKSIYAAVSKAEEMEREASFKTNQEIARLTAFHEKWVAYYNKVIKRYPLDDELIAMDKFNRQMQKIFLSGGIRDAADDNAAIKDRSLEKAYRAEKKRINDKKAGGFNFIKNTPADSGEDESLYRELVGISSPFDPIANIKKYYDNRPAEAQIPAALKNKRPQGDETAAAVSGGPGEYGEAKKETRSDADKDYSDRSPAGFSFQEALNPKDDLAKIIRDLGLLLEDD
jgi:DivIVA domain-containing protein